MDRSRILATALTILLVVTAVPGLLVAGEEDCKSEKQTKTMALPTTYSLTLTLAEAGEKYTFAMTVASRHFSMQLGDKNIALRGRFWEGPGDAELLDYTLEFTQWVQADSGRNRIGSTWNGSTYLRPGETVEIATFLDGSFSVRLDPVN